MKKIFLIIFLALFACKTSYIVELPDEQIESEESIVTKEKSNIFSDLIFKKKTKIALLLPITGKYQDIGQELLNAAALSLFENDSKKEIELVLFDSKGTEFGAKKALNDIINQDIKIVVGPLFSVATQAILNIAAEKEIILLSLSNSDNLLNKPNVFVTGVAIEQEIERLVEYSIANNLNSFSVIAPNNSYGLKVADLLRDTAKRKDGYFISSSFYKNSSQIDKSVNKIVNSYAISQSAYEDLSEEDKQKSIAEIPIEDEDKIYSDLILIADSGNNLNLILDSMEQNNPKKRNFQILGLKEWDKDATLYNVKTEGSWVVSSNPEIYKKYEYLYYNNYKKTPNRITAVIYDMVAAIIDLSYDNKDININDFIDKKEGFNGVDGTFRFLENGIVQRNFAILKIEDANFKVIDSDSRYFLEY